VKGARRLSAALLFFLCANLYSQNVSVSLASGLFFPQEKIYKDVYGHSLPVDLEFRVGLGRYFGLSVGAAYLNAHGNAVNADQGKDEYPVRLRMISFPVSVYVVYPFARISAFFGLGFSSHSYEEKWEGMALSHKGKKTSLIAQSGAELRLSSRISARLALRYERIEAEPASSLFDGVNLGGISLLGGFSFRIS